MPKLTTNQARVWKDAQEHGDSNIELIHDLLLTPDQDKWLITHDLSIRDVLEGNFACDLENEIIEKLYKPWNDTLEEAGLERQFMEEGMVGPMVDAIEDTFKDLGFEFDL